MSPFSRARCTDSGLGCEHADGTLADAAGGAVDGGDVAVLAWLDSCAPRAPGGTLAALLQSLPS
jgi:hypothetical protein